MFRLPLVLRSVAFVTLVSFIPVSVNAWEFIPDEQPEQDALARWRSLPWTSSDQIVLADSALPWSAEDEEQALIRLARTDNSGSDLDTGTDIENLDEDITPYRPTRLARIETNVTPNAADLLSELVDPAINSTGLPEDETEETNEQRVQVAQLGEVAETLPAIQYKSASQKYVSGGLDAVAMLESAETAYATGDLADSMRLLLTVINGYPASREGKTANQEMKAIGQLIGQGRISLERLDAVDAARPDWQTLTPEAKLAWLEFYGGVLRDAVETGNDAALVRLYGPGTALLQQLMNEHPNHPIITRVLNGLYEIAQLEGDTAVAAFYRNLEASCTPDDRGRTGLAGPIHAVAVLDRLNRYWSEVAHDYAKTRSFCMQLVKAANDERFLEMYQDSTVRIEDKYPLAWAVARAYWQLGRLDDARAWCAFGSEQLQDSKLAYYVAKLDAISVGDDYNRAILILDDYLKQYPNTGERAVTLLQMGGYYMRAGDWEGALDFFDSVTRVNPGSPESKMAQSETAFVMEHLYGTYWVAQVPVDDTDSGLDLAYCGPYALKGLLAQALHISVDIETLAQAAGTDPEGSTMLGLAEAAAAQGLHLSGVETKTPEDLATPFIAHVNNDHFVLVKSIKDNHVELDDVVLGQHMVPLGAFLSSWSGRALLVGNEDEQLASNTMSSAQLSEFKGGCDDSPTQGSGDEEEEEEGDSCPAGNSMNHNPNDDCKPCKYPPDTPQSPSTQLGISSPGVHVFIDTFKSHVIVRETDLLGEMPGPMSLRLERTFTNEAGFPRDSQTDMPLGWTTNFPTIDTGGSWYRAYRATYLSYDGVDQNGLHEEEYRYRTPGGSEYKETEWFAMTCPPEPQPVYGLG